MNVKAATARIGNGEVSGGVSEGSRTTGGQDLGTEGGFSNVMRSLTREVDRGEAVVTQALRHNPFADDTRGMIALQAGVYRYVEAVELVTRIVDRGTSAVRTTLQSQ